MPPRFANDVPQLEGHRLQMRRNPAERISIEGAKQLILMQNLIGLRLRHMLVTLGSPLVRCVFNRQSTKTVKSSFSADSTTYELTTSCSAAYAGLALGG